MATLKDEWLMAAMSDDVVVAELLIRLKHSQAASPSAKSQILPAPLLPFSWGTKQSRSRIKSASRCDGVVFSLNKESDSSRRSPTTPLSWSGGASPSATADGYEESSQPASAARSKFQATSTSEYTGNSFSTKRCRRKRTFAELKEEESSLLKERVHLKKEIAYMNATFRAHRATNESLKRMKLDVGSKSQNNPSSTSDEPHQRIVRTKGLANATEDDVYPLAADSEATKGESMGESIFMIPDLNIMPAEVVD